MRSSFLPFARLHCGAVPVLADIDAADQDDAIAAVREVLQFQR
jgi:hypothetical protein